MKRKHIIGRIYSTLQAMRARNIPTNKENTENLILQICNDYNCTRRTAREYIATAGYNFDKNFPLEIIDDNLINKKPEEMSEVEKARMNI